MTVYFIICRFIKTFCFIRIGSMNIFAFNHPDAYSFLATRIYIPRIFNCHLCICGMQASDMFVVEALLTSDENFP